VPAVRRVSFHGPVPMAAWAGGGAASTIPYKA
jgi:hypothetical protein